MPAPSPSAARTDPGRWQLGDEWLPSPLGGALTATDVTCFAPAARTTLLCGPPPKPEHAARAETLGTRTGARGLLGPWSSTQESTGP